MIMVIGVLIFSFFLESIVSNFIPLDTNFFVPLFSLISLIIIYPYFNGEKMNYLKVCAGIGLLYDVVFTDTLMMNLVFFILLGLFICFMNQLFSNNVFSVILISAIIIFFYRVMGYGILCLSGLFVFHMERLWESIFSSLLLNLIYASIIYLITDFLAKKYHIRKID